MLAARAVSTHPADPLAGLQVGDHPDPTPKPGWEIVDVHAASVNHHDVWTLRGVGISDEQLPVVLGCDAAGRTADGRRVIVHAIVADVDAPDDGLLTPGSSILSERHDGTFAQRLTVPSRNLVPLPDDLSYEQAACLPTAWLTAYRMLFSRAGLRPGDRVLIQGAGGGVATAALLLARAAGLHVTVTSRDAAKLERAAELGANDVVPTGQRLRARVRAVIETVGEATWDHSLKALEPDGVVVVAGATSGPNPPADLARVFFRQLRVIGSTMGTRRELEGLVAMLAATGVRPLIDDVLPLDQAAVALQRMVAGDLFGKLVLVP